MSEPAGRSGERRGAVASLSRWVAVVAGLQAVVLVAMSSRYGYHGDEFYFVVAGSHPAFGYPDQPALVPLLSWLMHDLTPGSLLVLRLPSAIVGATTTVLAALVARELGGSRRAQLIAAACTAVSGFALAASHLTSTTTSTERDQRSARLQQPGSLARRVRR